MSQLAPTGAEGARPGQRALTIALHDSVDAAQDLLLQQVELARAEALGEARHLGRTGAVLLVGVGTAMLGHLLLVAAAVALLSSARDLAWALLVVGLPHLLFGTAIVTTTVGRLSRAPALPEGLEAQR